MNLHYTLRSLVTVAALAAAGHLHAQSWQTVDDFQYSAGLGATGGDIGLDMAGNLYCVGSGIVVPDGSQRVGLVNTSTDDGSTWSTLSEFPEPGWSWVHCRAFTADSTGRLWVGGNGRKAEWSASELGWIVRESTDGISWTAADDLDGDRLAGCADIKIHPSTGDVYASGSSATAGRVIRRRAASASQFTTVYSAGPNDAGSGWSISFHPDGRVFVAGDSVGPVWLMQRSASGNAGTWSTVDLFRTSEWTQSSARASVASGSGAIHVAGWAYSSKTRKRHWIVRSSLDGGTTWSISDNFSLGGSTVDLSGMALDAAGRIFVCGQAADAAGKLWWLVRRGTPGSKLVKQGGKWVSVPTMAWTTSDTFQLAAGREARANGIVAESQGHVFVSGRAADAAGVDHWVVRRLAP